MTDYLNYYKKSRSRNETQIISYIFHSRITLFRISGLFGGDVMIQRWNYWFTFLSEKQKNKIVASLENQIKDCKQRKSFEWMIPIWENRLIEIKNLVGDS